MYSFWHMNHHRHFVILPDRVYLCRGGERLRKFYSLEEAEYYLKKHKDPYNVGPVFYERRKNWCGRCTRLDWHKAWMNALNGDSAMLNSNEYH